AFQGRRGAQAGAVGHTGDHGGIEPAGVVPLLCQGPGHSCRVGAPSAHGTRCDLAECTFPGLLLPVGDQSDPVVLAVAQCHVGAVFLGDGQARPAVVVGGFADQVARPGADQTPSGEAVNASSKAVRARRAPSASSQAGSRSVMKPLTLVQAVGDAFGGGVGDPRTHAGFGAGQVLELIGGAAHREQLQVQPQVVAALVHGCLVPTGNIGH